MAKKYYPREIEGGILARAGEFPVIVVTGPRQSGKSTLLRKIFGGYAYVSLDDPKARDLASSDPEVFLENYPGKTIIDEIQYVPGILPYLKLAVDRERGENGKYILTGSQMFPLMQGISESLAGRAAIFELLGFSMKEMKLPKKAFTAKECFELIFKGFFPEPCVHGIDADSFYGSYVQTYLERDIRQVKAVHDLAIFQSFMELLCARVGGLLNLNEIAKECGVSNTTVKNWLSVLESSRIVYLLRSYSGNVTKRVVKSPKLYLTDTGLAAYLLRYPSADTLMTSGAAGNVFEDLVVMELLKKKFNTNARWEMYFYRDSNHNEADIVLDMGHKKVLFEIKMTKTPREPHWNKLEVLCDTLGAKEAYLVSLSPDRLKVSRKTTLVPFWAATEVF